MVYLALLGDQNATVACKTASKLYFGQRLTLLHFLAAYALMEVSLGCPTRRATCDPKRCQSGCSKLSVSDCGPNLVTSPNQDLNQ